MYGNILWDSGLALAKFFAYREGASSSAPSVASKAVLDLGTGTGIVALTLAKLGASVMATDSEPQVLKLLEDNIRANGLTEAMTTHCLDWGDRTTYLRQRKFDVVVAADVLYSRRDRWFWRALEAHMARAQGTIAFVASPYRKDSPLTGFFELVQQAGLQLERLEDRAGRAAGGTTGAAEDVYAGSRFVAMTPMRCSVAATGAEFSESNEHKIQIFRLSWPEEGE